MSCEWGHDDCKFEGTEKCDTCFSDSFHYNARVVKKKNFLAKHSRKQDKRQGSSFEEKTRKFTAEAMSDKPVVQLTVNSGATVYEKGDVQIEGLVTAMIEDKTQTVVHQAKGSKTFTIRHDWLTKLLRESKQKNKEFHWLLFNFYEFDDDVYAITEASHILSMAKTMEADRRQCKLEQKKTDVAVKRKELVEAENIELKAEIALLKAELELKKM